jgi:hypothetical protein
MDSIALRCSLDKRYLPWVREKIAGGEKYLPIIVACPEPAQFSWSGGRVIFHLIIETREFGT